MREFIITNGDSAAGCLKAARLANKIIPWSDILYEGPVPMTEDLASLSRIRGQFIVKNQWASLGINPSEVFAERDAALAGHTEFDRVTLWFEHDLCDQLQLIQILDWFAPSPGTPGTLHLIQTDDHIGAQDPSTVGRFLPRLVQITDDHLSIARRAWHAFRQPTPTDWANLLNDDLRALPFLRAAVIRMLEELPATGAALTRTERQLLAVARGGCRNTVACSKRRGPPKKRGSWATGAYLLSWTGWRTPTRHCFASSRVVPTPTQTIFGAVPGGPGFGGPGIEGISAASQSSRS
jgi:hypothetical protein